MTYDPAIITELQNATKMKNTDLGLSVFYTSFDKLFLAKNFNIVDYCLVSIDFYEWPDTFLVALLTATFPAKDKLSYYHLCFDEIRAELSSRIGSTEANKLLKNLE